jgi:iron complex outermembrane recepter protein
MSMSLEELMEVEVSLTSRTQIPLFETAAATFVLTGEEIRRSGATSLPDALRLVPGMQVASIDANKWAISARGFANRFANKLLVLVDGRHVYSPYFAGVFWEVLDLPLEDIERIEVVRGPGATLWGANAVNGIVNVVTRQARDVRGPGVSVARGVESKESAVVVRYGTRVPGDGDLAVYGRHFARDRFVDAAGNGVEDEWETLGGGFRGDWDRDRDTFSLRGGLFTDEIEQNLPVERAPPEGQLDESQDAAHTGGHLLAHWRRALSPRSDLEFTGTYDLHERDDGLNDIRSHVVKLDFQHHLAVTPGRDVIWGASYQRTIDTARLAQGVIRPFDIEAEVFSAFGHVEQSRADGRLRLALGSKLEHNDYTGVEVQPSARVIWMPDPRHSLWVAVTRAVRTPAPSDSPPPDRPDSLGGGPFPGGPPPGGRPPGAVFPGFANQDIDYETEALRALEAGYRWHVRDGLLLDLAAFYNDYQGLHLIAFIPPLVIGGGGPPPSGPPEGLDQIGTADGVTWGGELVADWQVRQARLRAIYGLVQFDLERGVPRPAGTLSEQRFTLWPSLDLGRGVQLDAILRRVDVLEDLPFDVDRSGFGSALEGYTDLDLRLAWQVSRRWEVSLAGRNLLHEHRPELTGFVLDSEPSEIRRVVYWTVRWGL